MSLNLNSNKHNKTNSNSKVDIKDILYKTVRNAKHFKASTNKGKRFKNKASHIKNRKVKEMVTYQDETLGLAEGLATLDMLKFFSSQLPLQQIFDIAKRNRHARLMESEIALVTSSNEKVIDELMTDMVKFMGKDLTITEGKNIFEKITLNITYIRNRYSHIVAYFNNLSPSEKKYVVLDFLKKESDSLNTYKEAFENLVEVQTKIDRTLNEMLILSYYELYADNITQLRNELERTKPSNLNRTFTRIFLTVVINKPIFVAYFKKDLDYDILLDKFADLRVITRPKKLPVLKPKYYKFYQQLAKTALTSEAN